MAPKDQLSFAVSDLINNIEVGVNHVPLALLGEFQRDVNDFLRVSTREVDPSNVIIAIEPGSLSLVATGLLASTLLWRDLSQIETSNILTSIDTNRSKVIERWQKNAHQNPNRRYKVFNQATNLQISIDSKSNYHQLDEVWAHVEKYMQGKNC